MNQFEYLPIVAEQHRDELQKQAAESRRLRSAFATLQPKVRSTSRFLITIRKELLYIRFTLEARLDERREAHLNSQLQSNPQGCQ